MPSRAIRVEYDHVYHVYNRGFQKQQIFFCDQDYERFLEYLEKYLCIYSDVVLLAFCVLPNHFHFLVFMHHSVWGTNNAAQSSMSWFLRRLQQSYAMYLKSKYEEDVIPRWQVYEGRFQCKRVWDDTYLDHLIYYIENNAVKHGMVEKIEDWMWTSKNTRQSGHTVPIPPYCLFWEQLSSLIYHIYNIKRKVESGLEIIWSPDSRKNTVRTPSRKNRV